MSGSTTPPTRVMLSFPRFQLKSSPARRRRRRRRQENALKTSSQKPVQSCFLSTVLFPVDADVVVVLLRMERLSSLGVYRPPSTLKHLGTGISPMSMSLQQR